MISHFLFQTLSENAIRKRQDDAKLAELRAKLKKAREQAGTSAEGEEDNKDEVEDLSSISSAPVTDKAARLIGEALFINFSTFHFSFLFLILSFAFPHSVANRQFRKVNIFQDCDYEIEIS